MVDFDWIHRQCNFFDKCTRAKEYKAFRLKKGEKSLAISPKVEGPLSTLLGFDAHQDQTKFPSQSSLPCTAVDMTIIK
jgi:hypothetical protein